MSTRSFSRCVVKTSCVGDLFWARAMHLFIRCRPSISFFLFYLSFYRIFKSALTHTRTWTHTDTHAYEQTLARAHTRTCEPTQTHTHEAHFSFLTLSLVPPTWRHRHEIVPRGFFWWSDNIKFFATCKKIANCHLRLRIGARAQFKKKSKLSFIRLLPGCANQFVRMKL